MQQKSPQFVIEVKRDSRTLSAKDRDQALEYGKALKTPFVVVTNGKTIQCYNTLNGKPLSWNGRLTEKIPSKDQLPKVLAFIKGNPQATDISLLDDKTPFRPALPLKQLNALFKRCHNTIRKIEKNEESAFSDFSKFLFLKLLEEKADSGSFTLPYSYRFADLAGRSEIESDQVKVAIEDMLSKMSNDLGYGDVLGDPLRLKSPKTFSYIVQELSRVYFEDSNVDSKGAAFEYFVRATLKGKKLGQYFTPRSLIEVMVHLCGKRKIVNALKSGLEIRVIDPACGTGGFLVYLLKICSGMIQEDVTSNLLTVGVADKLVRNLRASTFFGSDANHGVACSAKMNMVVAGDGHTNITAEDSLSSSSLIWSTSSPTCDLILTNPPFGTSESASLTQQELAEFPVQSAKGQNLFLQKMVLATKAGGEICTVIDEGILNTDTARRLRRWLLQQCRIKAVMRLPEDTFKPNKINVRSSVLYMSKLDAIDHDLEKEYEVVFCDLESLGYVGSGDQIRNFDKDKLLLEVETKIRDQSLGSPRRGYGWRAFDVPVQDIVADAGMRLDLKYWEPELRTRLHSLVEAGGVSLSVINLKTTSRGKSPNADLYVDESDGFAAVIKAGSSITKYGEIVLEGDYVEEELYNALPLSAKVSEGDVLLASTGDGTLGKCACYGLSSPAVADSHVTIIRPDKGMVDPNYLTDYLRVGFGSMQVQRLYSGSTGLIELTPDHVNAIVVDTLGGDVEKQREVSVSLRQAEKNFRDSSAKIKAGLDVAVSEFCRL